MPRIGSAVVVYALAVSSSALAEPVEGPPPRPVYERCLLEDGIVGRRSCPEYGVWGEALEGPYVLVRLGMNMRHLPRRTAMPSTSQRGTMPPPAMGAGGSDTSYTMVEQISVATSRVSYLGVEMELSPITSDSLVPGARTYEAGGQLVAGLHGGAQTLKIGAELAAGARIVDDHRGQGEQGEGVLEARARGDIWLTPWFTVGADAGVSLLDRGEWFMGFCLGIHSYSYGGT